MHRFPGLAVAFLECGAGWASDLLHSIEEHWEKRRGESLRSYLDPTLLDEDKFRRYIAEYGSDTFARIGVDRVTAPITNPVRSAGASIEERDDWLLAGIQDEEDLEGFFDRFYFGCEADRPQRAPRVRSKLQSVRCCIEADLEFDIGHWIVVRCAGVLGEAYDPSEMDAYHRRTSEPSSATTPSSWTAANPRFFEGTAIESYSGMREGQRMIFRSSMESVSTTAHHGRTTRTVSDRGCRRRDDDEANGRRSCGPQRPPDGSVERHVARRATVVPGPRWRPCQHRRHFSSDDAA